MAGQYDVATVSNFGIPIYARSKWITPLDDFSAEDTQFDQDDTLSPMVQSLSGDDGEVYGQPFHGESSFLYYKDVLEHEGVVCAGSRFGARWSHR